MESPQVYCRSALGDKISDYEDLWSPQDGCGAGIVNTPLGRGPLMSSFRPDGLISKRPDLLPDNRKFLLSNIRICKFALLIQLSSFSYNNLTQR